MLFFVVTLKSQWICIALKSNVPEAVRGEVMTITDGVRSSQAYKLDLGKGSQMWDSAGGWETTTGVEEQT